jgi:predicted MFS family arabinose efflux permease
MTAPTAAPEIVAPAGKPPLVTRPLLIRFVSVAGASASFYLMLSVVPLFARATGASAGTAGLATTALSLSTVAGYLPTPSLVARFGHRRVLAAGLLLLGLPALALTASSSLPVIMAVCVVRGIGFAITCVSGGALTVALIPAGRRGEGLALIGVVSGVPSVAALPLGVWIAAHVGYAPVFVAAAVTALAALASVPALPGLPGRDNVAGARSGGMLAGLRTPAVIRPAIVFATTAMGAGIFVTFLPLAGVRTAAGVVALALLAESAAAIGGRWLAGRYGDRHGAAALVTPGVLAAAAGLALLSLIAMPVAVMAGAVLFGTGFGVTQNASLTLMYSRVAESGYSMVSAVWNLAYDAGMGLGAAGFGLLAVGAGYSAAFVVTASMLPVVLLIAGRKAPDRSTLCRASTTSRSGQMVFEFAGLLIAVDINCQSARDYPSWSKSVTVCAWMLTVRPFPPWTGVCVSAPFQPPKPPDLAIERSSTGR